MTRGFASRPFGMRFAVVGKFSKRKILAEKVDQMAVRLERSRSWIMKQALSAWIDQEEERNQLTREALADVDAGLVIDHQAVQAWANSLSTDDPLRVPR